MDHSQHNKIVSFIWSIADDCLRDVFVRGKYRYASDPDFKKAFDASISRLVATAGMAAQLGAAGPGPAEH